MRLYAKIVSATPMNTTPQATMSDFTLLITVVVAVSTGNTCAMASEAMTATASGNSANFFNIVRHPLSSVNFPQQEFHNEPHREPPEEEVATVANHHIDRCLIHRSLKRGVADGSLEAPPSTIAVSSRGCPSGVTFGRSPAKTEAPRTGIPSRSTPP